MMRLLELLADYSAPPRPRGGSARGRGRVGLGQRPRVIWPALALLFAGGHFLFTSLPRVRRWELAGWSALGVAGLFVLSLAYLLLTGLWSRRLAWVLVRPPGGRAAGSIAPAQAGGVGCSQPPHRRVRPAVVAPAHR